MLLMLAVFSLFAARLFQIQGLDASALAAEALRTRTSEQPLRAHRGDIVDTHGTVLATTVERRNITVNQKVVGEYEQRKGGKRVQVGVPGAARALAPVLDMSVAEIREKLTGTRGFQYVAKDVSPEVGRRVEQLHIPGVLTEWASRRVYPAGEIGAAVVGFVGGDGQPLGGVELAMRKVLAGRDGKRIVEIGNDRREIPMGQAQRVEPVAGATVHLTLDRDLQWKAQEAIAAQVARTRAESGYVVIQEVRTGDVLALATAPTFDANRPGEASVADRGNRALLDVFEPGSTSKVITAAAAIEEGVVTPATRMVVDDRIRRGGRVFHDSHPHEPERLTFTGVLAQSSNVGMIRAGEKISRTRMHEYLTQFGLGSTTGVGLPESRGILAPPDEWNDSQRYTILFGQGMAVTALQATGVFATIANGGVRLSPRVIAGTTASDGTRTTIPRSPGTRVISEDTAEQLVAMMESAVGDEGTAWRAGIPGYRVAGKTGTAQAPDSTCGCYRGFTASFVGLAPADDPQLVVSVVLQRPRRGHYGGVIATPVFKEVMSYALAHERIPPSGSEAPVLPATFP